VVSLSLWCDVLTRLSFAPSGGIVPRMKRVFAILATAVVFSVALFAADLTGSWTSKVDLGAAGGGTPSFVLKQDGEKLTGTYSGQLGEAPLHGTIKGSEVVWDFEVSGAQVHYAGKLDSTGNKIEGTVDYGGQASGTFVATRKEATK
jgi:hypothetical protein